MVTFSDPNKVGLNAATITDAAPEFELWVNGTSSPSPWPRPRPSPAG